MSAIRNNDHDALIANIEASLTRRLEHFGVKRGSKSALKIEAEFISGAMCALNVSIPSADPALISPAIPLRWLISVMRGTSILKD